MLAPSDGFVYITVVAITDNGGVLYKNFQLSLFYQEIEQVLLVWFVLCHDSTEKPEPTHQKERTADQGPHQEHYHQEHRGESSQFSNQ